jgi:hypothetical protein
MTRLLWHSFTTAAPTNTFGRLSLHWNGSIHETHTVPLEGVTTSSWWWRSLLVLVDVGFSQKFPLPSKATPTSGKLFYTLTHKGSGGNEKFPPRRIPVVGILDTESTVDQNTTNPQTSPPWWCRLPLLRRGICGYARSNAGHLFGKGWARTL